MKLIAEMCQNHNGDFDILKQMIEAAAEGGATHAKIQNIYASDLAMRQEFEEGQVDASGKVLCIKRPYQSEYDRLKLLELTVKEQEMFILECRKYGMIPLTTSFNIQRISEIADLGWRSIKVASYDCGSLPLIEKLSDSFDEIIVSTGATYNDEIEKTAKYLQQSQKQFSLLHCVTIYPTPMEQMHLRRMTFLKQFCDSVGLSNHSLTSRDGVKADVAALYLGAEVLERHFTILPEDQTRDGKVSIRKEHLAEIVTFNDLSESDKKAYIEEKIPEFDVMLGDENRTLSHEELLNRAYYRGRFCNKFGGKQVFNWEQSFDWTQI